MAKAYIDTEELLTTLEDYIEYDTFDIYKEEPLINMGFEQLEDIVTSQPTADVVEVVRCHNCEYHGIRDKCPLSNMSPYRDDGRGYCSKGKRME